MSRPFLLNHNMALSGHASDLDLVSILRAINGNSGNSVIAEGLCVQLGLTAPPVGPANIFDFDPADIDYQTTNRDYTHVVLILQDHINAAFNTVDWSPLVRALGQLTLPLVVVSLGCNGPVGATPEEVVSGLSPQLIAFVRFLGVRAVSIGTRGLVTARVLRLLGVENHAVVGCPSYFLHGAGRRVNEVSADAEGPVLAGGLFANAEDRDVHFMLQSELGLIETLAGSRITHLAKISELRARYPGYLRTLLQAGLAGRLEFFVNPAAWRRRILDLKPAVSVGTRVHGAIQALNSGVPAFVTAGDLRAREMCELFGIPRAHIGGTQGKSVADLRRMASTDVLNAVYDDRYARFVAWLTEAGLGPVGGSGVGGISHWEWVKIRSKPLADRVDGLLRHLEG